LSETISNSAPSIEATVFWPLDLFTNPVQAVEKCGYLRSAQRELLAEAVRSLVPTRAQLNIASAARLQIDSLADRIREEIAAKRPGCGVVRIGRGLGKKAGR
jgi:hypothetical protein